MSAPVSYSEALRIWQRRLDQADQRLWTWRLVAATALGTTALLALALVVEVRRSIVQPYLIEVAPGGQIQRVTAVGADVYRPTDAIIEHELAAWIRAVRGLSTDPAVVRDSWLSAFARVTARGADLLGELERELRPRDRVGREQVGIEIVSVHRLSEATYRVAWRERTRRIDSGELSEAPYSAVLTIRIEPPQTGDALMANPSGVYVDAFDIARELP